MTNLEVLAKRPSALDQSIRTVLAWVFHLHHSMTSNESALYELLSRLLRLYAAIFQHELTLERTPSWQLHTRCRQVGLCGVLREFSHSATGEPDTLSIGREDARVHVTQGINQQLTSSKSAGSSTHTLRALAYMIAKCVQCSCHD